MFLQADDALRQVENLNVHHQVGRQALSDRHKPTLVRQTKLLQLKTGPHLPLAGREKTGRDGVGVAGPDEGGLGAVEEVEVLLQ